jgi:uncharacterized protein (DUF1800 family)
MPVTPYTGTFGREELKHLLRRSLFGATNADLATYAGQTLAQVVDALLNVDTNQTPPLKNYWRLNGNTPDPSLVDANIPFGTTWVNTPNVVSTVDANVYRMASFFSWRVGLMVTQPPTILEKMMLFWTNHVCIQTSEVYNGLHFYGYDQLLRSQCLGNFRALMYDVTVHPAMLEYLNGENNSAVAPDENYGRELMELFTLGEGSGYTEADVQAAARVLTGWAVREILNGTPILPESYFTASRHDSNNKTFSSFFANTTIQGQSGAGGGATEINALLDMIFLKQEVSLFMCRNLYRFFVHGEISAQAEAQVIVPLAEIFRANAGAPDQMKTVMRALLMSDHFFSANIRACMMMSPADLIIGTTRKMKFDWPSETTQVEGRYKMFQSLFYICVNCFQNLFDPPSVAGWPGYYLSPQFDELWLDSASYAARNSAVQGIIGQGFNTGDQFYQVASRNLLRKPDLMAAVAEFGDASDPNVVVAGCADMLYAIPISQGILDTLKTNRLLLGQASDIYWSDAYEIYVADPNTTNQTAQMVPNLLTFMLLDMGVAAETQMF